MTSAKGQLDYVRSKSVRSGEKALRIAVYCGAIPLVLGVSILFGYYTTHAEILPVAGFLTILVGSMMFLVGIISLTISYGNLPRADGRLATKDLRQLWIVLLLLLSNFPVGLLCLWAGARLLGPPFGTF